MSARLSGCPAPAKLNTFLHVVGRREDGYHLLQSHFRLIDWSDTLDFVRRDDGLICRTHELPGVPESADLTLRAARLLKERLGTPYGVDITLHKVLPTGAGLGGGSSDAATTLIALDRLWHGGLSRAQLMELGLQLGADVPFFLFGEDAFVEGIGERLTPCPGPERWFLILWPGIHVSTAQVFASPRLTRNTPVGTIASLATTPLRNDLEPVVRELFPEVDAALEWLARHAGTARMSGSGSCVFAEFAEPSEAGRIAAKVPSGWQANIARTLHRHPLHDWL